MLCPKCKTAAPDGNKCGYCGAKIRRSTAGKKAFLGALCACVVAAGAGYMYLDANSLLPAAFAEEEEHTENTPPPQANAAEQPAAAPTERADDGAANADDGAGVFDKLGRIERALSQYCYLYGVSVNFVSRNGYIFNYDEQRFVTVYDLTTAGLLEPEYADGAALLLYLRPASFRGYKEADFGIDPDLRAFAAYDILDGIAVCADGAASVVYREHFNEIMAKYAVRAFAAFEPLPEDDDFKAIVAAAQSEDKAIVPRYIRYDGKYAVFMFSFAGEAENLRGYALSNDGWEFSLLADFSEEKEKYIELINAAAPDFNLETVPKLTANAFYGAEKLAYITTNLAAQEKIAEDDAAVYACGTDDALYMEYASGKKFFGVKNQAGMWALEECQTRAEARIKAAAADAPLLAPLGE